MNPNQQAAKEALKRSQIALRKGEKDVARRWAEKAASLAPELEDPWLLLAAVSRPQISIHYLERALALNPNSERAQKGMAWAQRRLKPAPDSTKPHKVIQRQEENTQPTPAAPVGGILHIHTQLVEETQPTQKPVASKPPARSWRQSLPALLLTVIVVSGVWALFPSIASLAADLKTTPTATLSQSHWGEANISKPTYTPSPTATFTPTLTPTITPSPTITPTFTLAPTQTPYPTAEPQEEAPPAPQPQGSNLSGAKYVLVDISEQHLYAYQGDTLIYSFVASTGMNNATATGNFSVLNKIPSAYGSTWDIWMPNWLGIYWAGTLQNGIHALPIMSNGGTLWAGYLGTPISYGCVVLGTYEAQQLYEWVDVGTPVDIQW